MGSLHGISSHSTYYSIPSAAVAGSGGGGFMMNNLMIRRDRAFEFGGGGCLRPGAEIVSIWDRKIALLNLLTHKVLIANGRFKKIELPEVTLMVDYAAMNALVESPKLKRCAEIK